MSINRWRIRTAAGTAGAIIAQLAVAVSATQPAHATVPVDRLTVTTTQVAAGLQRPTAVAAPDDGSGRLFITEKQGRVRVYHPDTGLAAAPLLDIRDRLNVSGNERGLLAIATTPDFARTHTLYVLYTALPDGAVTLARFPLDSAGQNPVPPAAGEVVLAQPHAQFANHNGGDVKFGPDGFLYLSIGDGGGGGDPLNSGQNLATLLGKILRVDVNRSCEGRTYCVPTDNPFVNRADARPEIWAYGLRNPWRFSFDAQDGSLWIGDVGQNSLEEVNHVTTTQARGANFGWSCREGTQVFNQDRCVAGAQMTDPVLTYQTSVDGCSVVGGVVYRGQKFADLADGTYVVTDYCSAAVWAIRPNGDGSYDKARIGVLPIAQPTSFGVDTEGELYLINDRAGQLHKVSFGQVAPAAG
jgi:glucose/arabinose dehydrogenase